MTAQERRELILKELKTTEKPLSATALAKNFGVSRQIVVGDIALLRASGATITSTARGYLLSPSIPGIVRRIACNHSADQMVDELNAIVDEGCTVIDVIVEHPLYNALTGTLQLSSRYDVSQFIERSRACEAKPLSALTEGVHLHTISCPDEAALLRVEAKLSSMGILLS